MNDGEVVGEVLRTAEKGVAGVQLTATSIDLVNPKCKYS
jgi:hypothetical protein